MTYVQACTEPAVGENLTIGSVKGGTLINLEDYLIAVTNPRSVHWKVVLLLVELDLDITGNMPGPIALSYET